MIVTVIKGIFLVYGGTEAVGLVHGMIKHREKGVTPFQYAVYYLVGFIANFFDVLGIGSLAPTLATYKLTKTVDDDLIPGTLVIGCAIPVILEALLFLTKVEVEILTLVGMYGCGIIGALIGGKVATKLPVKALRITMGVGFLSAGALMMMSKFGLMPLGGNAIGLHGIKLVIACIGSFILAALLTVGIGNYAPTMVMVYMLGMNPAVAFPIMMGLGALGVCNGSFPYFASNRYHHHAAFAFTAAGVVGVLIAVYLVTSLPLSVLQWLVILVAFYTGITMLKQAFARENVAKANVG